MPADKALQETAAIWLALLDLKANKAATDSKSDKAASLAVKTKDKSLAIDVSDGYESKWNCSQQLSVQSTRLLDLFLPICFGSAGERPYIYAHLGQSLDGKIATLEGASQFITGDADLDHTHRLRALADCIVVGAGTVDADNPALTTRRVSGPNPVRVVIDPNRRIAAESAIFGGPGHCLRIVAGEAQNDFELGVPAINGQLPPRSIASVLAGRGYQSIFIEGGGKTISRFLASTTLDRLHLCIAPTILGSGRSALELPVISKLSESLRPKSRNYTMGQDVLFDCHFDD